MCNSFRVLKTGAFTNNNMIQYAIIFWGPIPPLRKKNIWKMKKWIGTGFDLDM